MSDDKISDNDAIEAALRLDGDPEKVREYYESWAEKYDIDVDSAGYSGPAVAAQLLPRFLPGREARLLDAGCGTGMVGRELAALGYAHIDGFDLSQSMAERALETGSYREVRGGVDMMRAAEIYAADYDALLSIGVFTLGHVPPQALEVMIELARPGGLLLLSTRTHYYEETDFGQLVERLVAAQRLELLHNLRDAPYNYDGDAHYWVFRKAAAGAAP